MFYIYNVKMKQSCGIDVSWPSKCLGINNIFNKKYR